MFTNISWSNYGIAIGLVVLVWYLFLGFRFYYEELKQFISGKRSITIPFLGNKNKEPSYLDKKDKDDSTSSKLSSASEPFRTLEDEEGNYGVNS